MRISWIYSTTRCSSTNQPVPLVRVRKLLIDRALSKSSGPGPIIRQPKWGGLFVGSGPHHNKRPQLLRFLPVS